MKLYIKQKVFSFGDRFGVKNEYGEDVFFVEGDVFTFGKQLHVYDPSGSEVAYVEQKLFSFLPRYFLYKDGTLRAEIVKEFSFFRPHYTVEGLGWEIEGDFFDHDYVVTNDSRPIVTITKEWLTWGDTYVLDFEDGVDVVMALTVVLAIDCVLDRD